MSTRSEHFTTGVRLPCLAVIVLGMSSAAAAELPATPWAWYGGDEYGRRYSPLAQITPENVADLEIAWTYSTGEVERRGPELIQNSSTQSTPLVVDGKLLVCTPFNRLVALDPASGDELWVYDAEIDLSFELPFQYNCRGVAVWNDAEAEAGAHCASRVLMGTSDARLIAVDLDDGQPCRGFGSDGVVPVPSEPGTEFPGERKLQAAPLVVNDIVVVGSSIMDNLRTDAPRGTVHAFDARTGKPAWQFDPIPRSADDPAWETWHDGSAARTGAANVWTGMVADAARELVYLPVSSASPDFWGGERPGDNLYSSSLVALDAKTGTVRWHFQHIHHDIWDYDTSSPPLLADIRRDGKTVAAVIQNTKQGFSFVLDRETGKPVFGVEERPVPQDALEGEWLSPTQPWPLAPPPLVPTKVTPDDAWGFTPWDRRACRKRIEELRSEGIFTPPSTAPGTLLSPGTAGGMNWGGAAFDPASQLMFVNVSNAPQVVTLVPREEIPDVKGISLVGGRDTAEGRGTPYGVRREWLVSPSGAPCVPPPWGELVAVDMAAGEIVWRVPLGSIEKFLPFRIPWTMGTPNIGGPIVTAGGLVFIGAAMDDKLRAFDVEDGEELFVKRMPAGTQTTPITYAADGRQFVVIVTGQHLWFGSTVGDEIVALALPREAISDQKLPRR